MVVSTLYSSVSGNCVSNEINMTSFEDEPLFGRDYSTNLWLLDVLGKCVC